MMPPPLSHGHLSEGKVKKGELGRPVSQPSDHIILH